MPLEQMNRRCRRTSLLPPPCFRQTSRTDPPTGLWRTLGLRARIGQGLSLSFLRLCCLAGEFAGEGSLSELVEKFKGGRHDLDREFGKAVPAFL